jgi:hypothetical protein
MPLVVPCCEYVCFGRFKLFDCTSNPVRFPV